MRAWLRLIVIMMIFGPVSIEARDITTVSGKVYRGIKVLRVEKHGINISHDDGVAFIDLKELPPSLEDEFGLKEEDYAAGVARRRETDAAILEMQRQQALKDAPRQNEVELQRLQGLAHATAFVLPTPRPIAIATRDYSERGYANRSYNSDAYASRNYIGSGRTYSPSSGSTGGTVHVRSYTRKDGTVVRAHTRRR